MIEAIQSNQSIQIKIANEVRENTLEKKSIMDRFEIGLKNISENGNKKNNINGKINGEGSNGNSHANPDNQRTLVRNPLVLSPPSSPSVFEAFSSIPTAAILKLKPIHIRILNLYKTAQFKRYEIAEIVGVSAPTVTNTLKSPAAVDILLDNYKNIKEDFNVLSNLAVDALRDGLTSKSEEQRVKAAVDYFKLINTQMKKKVEITGKVQVEVEDIKNKMFVKLGLDPTILINMDNDNGAGDNN